MERVSRLDQGGVVSSGCAGLDQMLLGGFPKQRAILLSGGPGVGKSTLAMQFLQAGLENGEECLYVSTEQTTEELRSSFEPFEFDLHDENLTIASIHASPDSTLEEAETGLALKTLQGDETIDGPFTYPFEGQYIIEYLEQFAPCDRVVLDSASGLQAVSEDQNRFRRVILDLIRLFTDTFEASTIFTAEEHAAADAAESLPASNVLQFTTHGVIRLWWGDLRGGRRRLLQIVKMRGVDHDTREFEVGFNNRGIFLAPEQRTQGFAVDDDSVFATGIRGLDEMSGGGLVRGHGLLVEHDGRAKVDNLVVRTCAAALHEDMAIWLIPSPILDPGRFDDLLEGDSWDSQSLLDENRLFVLDGFSIWSDEYGSHRNVFTPPTGGIVGGLLRGSSTLSLYLVKKVISTINERRDQAIFSPVYTETFLRWLDPSEVREIYYWAREAIAHKHDTGFFIHNPETMDDKLAEFFHSDAEQAFETWVADNGIQYLQLNKSPFGEPGTTKVVEYTPSSLEVR